MRHPHWHSRNDSMAKQWAGFRRDLRKSKPLVTLTRWQHGTILDIIHKDGIRATYQISNTQAKLAAKNAAI